MTAKRGENLCCIHSLECSYLYPWVWLTRDNGLGKVILACTSCVFVCMHWYLCISAQTSLLLSCTSKHLRDTYFVFKFSMEFLLPASLTSYLSLCSAPRLCVLPLHSGERALSSVVPTICLNLDIHLSGPFVPSLFPKLICKHTYILCITCAHLTSLFPFVLNWWKFLLYAYCVLLTKKKYFIWRTIKCGSN